MPLVSVLMPSYQHAEYVAAAMQSVLDQSVDNLELLVIDDASTDGSPAIIQDFAARDARVRPLLQETNQGIARTFNVGLREARGKFVAVLASDDLWMDHKLEKELAVLRMNEDLIVWCEGLMVDGQGNPTGELAVRDHIKKYAAHDETEPDLVKIGSGRIEHQILRGRLVLFAGLIAKTEAVREFGFDPNLKYMNDVKLSLDLAGRYDYCFIPEPLVKYRWHGDNSCTCKDVDGWARDGEVFRDYFLHSFGTRYPVGSGQRSWVLGVTLSLLAMKPALRADGPSAVGLAGPTHATPVAPRGDGSGLLGLVTDLIRDPKLVDMFDAESGTSAEVTRFFDRYGVSGKDREALLAIDMGRSEIIGLLESRLHAEASQAIMKLWLTAPTEPGVATDFVGPA
jgi:glycosyltransferase involved in cell wall biosynthesis